MKRKGAAMTAHATFWRREMTVKLSNGNGSETVVRLSMQSVIDLSTVFVVAVISGLFIWVNALSTTVSNHGSDIAVLKQVDTAHKETLSDVNCKLDKVVAKVEEIREYQLRKDRRERSER